MMRWRYLSEQMKANVSAEHIAKIAALETQERASERADDRLRMSVVSVPAEYLPESFRQQLRDHHAFMENVLGDLTRRLTLLQTQQRETIQAFREPLGSAKAIASQTATEIVNDAFGRKIHELQTRIKRLEERKHAQSS